MTVLFPPQSCHPSEVIVGGAKLCQAGGKENYSTRRKMIVLDRQHYQGSDTQIDNMDRDCATILSNNHNCTHRDNMEKLPRDVDIIDYAGMWESNHDYTD